MAGLSNAEIICAFDIEGYCQPKQRTIGNYRTPPETRAYEKLIKDTARLSMRGKLPYTGFVKVDLRIICAIPKSFTGTRHKSAQLNLIAPTHCDLDNCIKALLDGMNKIAFSDDRFVCEINAHRRFGEKDIASVWVSAVDGVA